MGRYVTVQTYSDTNSRATAVPYERASKGGAVPDATKGTTVKGFKPQVVNNVMGSVAGSGSGDFHHYRNDRAREQYRLRKMDEDWERDQKDKEFVRRVAQSQKKCEERTRKRAEKRRRRKEAAREAKARAEREADAAGAGAGAGSGKAGAAEVDEAALPDVVIAVPEEEAKHGAIPFANDGSFLEMMKKKLAAGGAGDDETGSGSGSGAGSGSGNVATGDKGDVDAASGTGESQDQANEAPTRATKRQRRKR